MKRTILFILVFAAVCVLLDAFGNETCRGENADRADESSLFADTIFADRPVFSADIDLYLGQKKRRRGSGGRVWSNLYYAGSVLRPENVPLKIKPESYGVQIGFDVVKAHGIYSTFFTNINQSNTDFHSQFSGDSFGSKIENYLFGYGKFFYLRGCHFGYTGSLGYDEYAVYTDDRMKGSGLQTHLFGEFGVDLLLGKWAFKPFYDLQYDFLYHGRIGDSNLPDHISDQNGHSFKQLAGLRLNWKPVEMLEWQFRSTWIHEYLNEPQPFYDIRFSSVQGVTTPSLMYFVGDTGRDWAWLGCGLKIEAVFNLFLFFDYDVTFNARQTSHLGNFGLCLGW